jgi:hypothetical protein
MSEQEKEINSIFKGAFKEIAESILSEASSQIKDIVEEKNSPKKESPKNKCSEIEENVFLQDDQEEVIDLTLKIQELEEVCNEQKQSPVSADSPVEENILEQVMEEEQEVKEEEKKEESKISQEEKKEESKISKEEIDDLIAMLNKQNENKETNLTKMLKKFDNKEDMPEELNAKLKDLLSSLKAYKEVVVKKVKGNDDKPKNMQSLVRHTTAFVLDKFLDIIDEN